MMLRLGGIYVIRNRLDGRVYVGSTINGDHRWAEHKCGLRAGTHRNAHLQRAWNRCREEDFNFTFICSGKTKTAAGFRWEYA